MPSKIQKPQRPVRNFLPEDITIDAWSKLEPYFQSLTDRKINSVADLEKWLKDRSELEAVIEENGAWRYIKMTINTKDEQAVESYNFFVSEIEPKIAPYQDSLNRIIIDSSFRNQLDQQKYFIYLRSIEQELKLFCEKNIALQSEISVEAQRYGMITGAQSISVDGQEMTMPKAATFLKSINREERQRYFEWMTVRREQDTAELDVLFDKLLGLRNQVAANAGFSNYRDYMFASLGRFDYSVHDCENFHESIRTEIVPITKQFMVDRKTKLGLDQLKPWDTEVDTSGKPALKPFTNGTELIEKTISALNRIDSYFGECIAIMNLMGHLDLESKDGKAPGGYNYPLYEIGVPFIFMNSVGSQRDLVTMVHEGGHAIHSFLTRNLELTAFKGLPSEVAELASMTMELISMDVWDEFYSDPAELKRAKKDQLEKILGLLPWIAIVDKFQHWLYTNPNHTASERSEQWVLIQKEFSTGMVDWSGYESSQKSAWQKQLHIYEVPFYYIEYGMAQLGAIALWRNYKSNPKKAIEQYKTALSLGYTKSIPEVYQAAGISFNFSGTYVKELSDFVKKELELLHE